MKTLLLLFLLAALSAVAQTGRVITENGTNILAIGIDARDFSVIRFYMEGTNVLELRADDLAHKGRNVLAPASTNGVERAALRASLKTRVNGNTVPANQLGQALAEFVRLQELDEADEADRKKPKEK